MKEEIHFFFDANISKRLARMLDAYDIENTIRAQMDDNHFQADTPDIEIIRRIAKYVPRPVFVTADRAIRGRPDERIALAESGLTVVFLRAGFTKLNCHQQAIKLLAIWPEIVNAVSRCKVATAFEIGPNARKVDTIGPTANMGSK